MEVDYKPTDTGGKKNNLTIGNSKVSSVESLKKKVAATYIYYTHWNITVLESDAN